MNQIGPHRDAGEHTSPTVSVLTVPALLGGVILGFLAGYILMWWGVTVVILVVMSGFAAFAAGRQRDASAALIVGTMMGYAAVVLLAAFRGAL